MSLPLVSVLLPNYNNGAYLKECLDSLFNQTFTDFVVLLVDDASTDNSLEVARSYGDKRLKIIPKNKQSGIVDSLNLGLKEVESKYFIRMDGDDIASPDRFETLVNFMEENAEIDVCGSAIQAFGVRDDLQIYPSSPKENKANLIFGHTIGHASCIFRTKVMKTNGIVYEDNYWRLEDYDLFYRLKDIAVTTSIPDKLYLYRQEAYNVNEEIEKRKREEYIRFYQQVLKDLNLKGSRSEGETHLELALKAAATQSHSVYKNHVKNLIAANLRTQNYPHEIFKNVLQHNLNRIKYKLVDQQQSLKRMAPLIFTDFKLLKYWLAKNLKK